MLYRVCTGMAVNIRAIHVIFHLLLFQMKIYIEVRCNSANTFSINVFMPLLLVSGTSTLFSYIYFPLYHCRQEPLRAPLTFTSPCITVDRNLYTVLLPLPPPVSL